MGSKILLTIAVVLKNLEFISLNIYLSYYFFVDFVEELFFSLLLFSNSAFRAFTYAILAVSAIANSFLNLFI